MYFKSLMQMRQIQTRFEHAKAIHFFQYSEIKKKKILIFEIKNSKEKREYIVIWIKIQMHWQLDAL